MFQLLQRNTCQNSSLRRWRKRKDSKTKCFKRCRKRPKNNKAVKFDRSSEQSNAFFPRNTPKQSASEQQKSHSNRKVLQTQVVHADLPIHPLTSEKKRLKSLRRRSATSLKLWSKPAPVGFEKCGNATSSKTANNAPTRKFQSQSSNDLKLLKTSHTLAHRRANAVEPSSGMWTVFLAVSLVGVAGAFCSSLNPGTCTAERSRVAPVETTPGHTASRVNFHALSRARR